MQLYDEGLYETLRADKSTVSFRGLKINVKAIPDEKQAGYLDPRELALLQNRVPEPMPEGLPPIEKMRRSMGFPNRNMNTVEIHTKFEAHTFGGNPVNFWIYTPRKPEDKQDRPALFYIHGGGWVGGSPYTVENPCKLIAERADCVVINVEYSLAPEKPFPNGFNDCWAALKYLHIHADAYGIDPNRIGVAGDSAGGNLAAVCAMVDRDLGTNIIKYQALIYPLVTFMTHKTPGYKWNIDRYEIAEPFKEILEPALTGMAMQDEDSQVFSAYLRGRTDDARSVYASPMLFEKAGMAKTLMVSAEYCGLRVQDEIFAAQLNKAGVDVRCIRYKGVMHMA